jgi:hypothetical protein
MPSNSNTSISVALSERLLGVLIFAEGPFCQPRRITHWGQSLNLGAINTINNSSTRHHAGPAPERVKPMSKELALRRNLIPTRQPCGSLLTLLGSFARPGKGQGNGKHFSTRVDRSGTVAARGLHIRGYCD